MNIISLKTQLSNSELFLIAVIMISRSEISNSSVKSIVSQFNLEGKFQIDSLYRKGYVYRTSRYGTIYYTANKKRRFSVLTTVLEKFPDFVTQYKKAFQYYYNDTALLDFVDKFVHNDPYTLKDELKNYTKWDSLDGKVQKFYPLLYHDELCVKQLITLFEPELLTALIQYKLRVDYCENYDNFSSERYIDILNLHSKRNHTDFKNLIEEVKVTQFFLDGEKPDFDQQESEMSLAVDAIFELYKGNLENSYTLFTKSLKYHNQHSECKFFYENPILTLFLILCYARSDSSDARKKAAVFVKKPYTNELGCFIPFNILARYFCLNETVDTTSIDRLDYDSLATSSTYYCYMLLHHLFAKNGYHIIPKLNLKNIPRSIFIKYELSPFINVGNVSQIKDILEGKPICSGIGRKEEWESALDEIFDLMPKNSQKKKVSQQTQRVIYVICDNYIEAREQKILKNGEWSNGSSITFTSFVSGKLKYLDETDLKVINAHRDVYMPRGYKMLIRDVIPMLIDSDKIFYQTNSLELQRVKVRTEKVFISVEKSQKGYFNITSNISNSFLGNGNVIVSKVSNTEYVVFEMTSQESLIVQKLTALATLPLKAEKTLISLFEAINGAVEIHSSLIKGGSSLETIDTDSRIHLLVKPQNDSSYHITIIVRPLTDGKIELYPGKGTEMIYDSNNNVRYQIKRNLKKESEFYELIENYMYNQLSDSTCEDDFVWTLSPIDMLELLSFLKENKDNFIIEWQEGKEIIIRSKITTSMVTASIKHKESWFEMEGSVKVDKTTVLSIQELLDLFEQSGETKFVKLSDDQYIVLEDTLRKQLQKIKEITTSNKRIPIFQVGAIAEVALGDNPLLKVDKKFLELEKKMEEASKLNPKVPLKLQADLREYQIDGYRWMTRLAAWGAGACLADDMGLGKTIQTIALILYREGPSLVVAPASVVLNWASELEKFAPSLNVTILNESNSREDVIKNATKNDVVLCSYGILQREEDVLADKKWDLVCLDEAHTIKNHGTKTSSAAMKLQSEARVALTGTPIQNNLAELWNIFQFLNPGLLGSFESFSKRFSMGTEGNKGSARRLKAMIQPFILRRRKADVIEELPEKTEIKRMVDLTDQEMAVYETFREQAAQSMKQSDKVDINILSQITKLRQASCSINLVMDKWTGANSKADAVIELMTQITEGGNRALVFSQFTTFLQMVKEKYIQSGANEEDVLYLDGSTPIRKREELVSKFQKRTGNIFFISLKAGGLGLNLTGANYVIHMDPWWNPAIEAQATDRTHRIGQKQKVTVYHILSNNTIEEKILRLHKVKKDMADFLMEGTDTCHTLTLDDLRELVKND